MTTAMKEKTKRKGLAKQESTHYRVHLPGFIKGEIGLGDVIKRTTYAVGIKPCTGCVQRAAMLNRWISFSG